MDSFEDEHEDENEEDLPNLYQILTEIFKRLHQINGEPRRAAAVHHAVIVTQGDRREQARFDFSFANHRLQGAAAQAEDRQIGRASCRERV